MEQEVVDALSRIALYRDVDPASISSERLLHPPGVRSEQFRQRHRALHPPVRIRRHCELGSDQAVEVGRDIRLVPVPAGNWAPPVNGLGAGVALALPFFPMPRY